jgi:adenylate cyclase
MVADDGIDGLNAWLAEAGLRGEPEPALVNGFCERALVAGLPISRALVIIDTLHPVYEGRVFRWGPDPSQATMVEYGRTGAPDGVSHLEAPDDGQRAAIARWQASPFFRMLQTGESLLRCRLAAESEPEFQVLREYRTDGMTDYVAILSRFAPEGVIGEMDCVYSSWTTAHADGFADHDLAALTRLVPTLALAIKAAALARMTGTLMETYLGRDAGRRVLGGRIMRGVADRIDAVIWFSDLRGFTRITDSAPDQVIPLLNDYADVVISAIHRHGGDVLKLIGDGILAIFSAESRARACAAALAAATETRSEVAALNLRRAGQGLPVTDMYLGLHVGEVLYGNIGSTERLDFTAVGPAVNEANRIGRHVPVARAAGAGVPGLRRCRWDSRQPRIGRPLCAARRGAAAGAVHARLGPAAFSLPRSGGAWSLMSGQVWWWAPAQTPRRRWTPKRGAGCR